MNEIRINTWNELQEAVFADSYNERIGRHRSQFVFRGLSDTDYHLLTALQRLGGDYPAFEHHLLRNFKKYAHQGMVEADTDWHWLSVAQHHGLPTRLLDWTYSPLIAMHFATANLEQYDKDGAIWCVHFGKVHQLLPDELLNALNAEGADMFTVDMIEDKIPSIRKFNTMQSFPFFFEPPSMDKRIMNQYALFSINSDVKMEFNDWLTDHPDLWKKIIIPANLKWEIRDKLDQANVSERVLFPGLEGISQFLKRQYTQKDALPFNQY